jgi:signal transduction histidine kinase
LGDRIQTRRGEAEARAARKLTVAYLAIFAGTIAALSLLAFFFVDAAYRDAYEPALGTPAAAAALAHFRRGVAGTIALCDAVLIVGVGLASYALARAAVRPLTLAREREARFAADAAHELRTPLAAIASLAQAAREGTSEERRAALEAIADRALRAGALLGDLLTLARRGDADVLQREPVDLAGIATRVARDTNSGAVALDVRVASAIVDGDERRLEQLVRNLLANALRHAGSRVSLSVAPDGGSALLRVEDDGPGVSPEVVPRLFERFAKGADSPGSGLGLAICRWVARAHGGEVAYEGGSRFCARLPLGRYPAATPEPRPGSS